MIFLNTPNYLIVLSVGQRQNLCKLLLYTLPEGQLKKTSFLNLPPVWQRQEDKEVSHEKNNNWQGNSNRNHACIICI
jgi:hypothetical protein